MDVTKVYTMINNLIKKIKSGQGPFFLECKTYRFVGHSRSDTNKYRQKSEEIFWKKKDPIIRIEKKLAKEKILDNLSINKIHEEIKYELNQEFLLAKTWFIPIIVFLFSHLTDITFYDGKISILISILFAGLKCILNQKKKIKTNFI